MRLAIHSFGPNCRYCCNTLDDENHEMMMLMMRMIMTMTNNHENNYNHNHNMIDSYTSLSLQLLYMRTRSVRLIWLPRMAARNPPWTSNTDSCRQAGGQTASQAGMPESHSMQKSKKTLSVLHKRLSLHPPQGCSMLLWDGVTSLHINCQSVNRI